MKVIYIQAVLSEARSLPIYPTNRDDGMQEVVLGISEVRYLMTSKQVDLRQTSVPGSWLFNQVLGGATRSSLKAGYCAAEKTIPLYQASIIISTSIHIFAGYAGRTGSSEYGIRIHWNFLLRILEYVIRIFGRLQRQFLIYLVPLLSVVQWPW